MMTKIKAKFSVYFEDPFWVGIYERQEGDSFTAARVVFGKEPKDYEIYEFLLKSFSKLRFSPSLQGEQRKHPAGNPKRMQRQIQKELSRTGTSTKAQQAISRMQEMQKETRISRRHQVTEEEKARKFQLRQQKKKEKHRGH